MPSPFPGMDPFIESQLWSEYHYRAINTIADLLWPQLGDRYVARCQMRVYVERAPSWEEGDAAHRLIKPDIGITWKHGSETDEAFSEAAIATIECDLPEPEECREAYLVLKDVDTQQIVTVLELLSPTNKRPGADGRGEYVRKREEILQSETHLVEIDLLRGGERMPMRPRTPVDGDYVAMISRAERRPRGEMVVWQLSHRMPVIPIPRVKGDSDISLDLQTVLDSVYDRDRYRRILDYSRPLVPPADDTTEQWISDVLGEKRLPAAQRK